MRIFQSITHFGQIHGSHIDLLIARLSQAACLILAQIYYSGKGFCPIPYSNGFIVRIVCS